MKIDWVIENGEKTGFNIVEDDGSDIALKDESVLTERERDQRTLEIDQLSKTAISQLMNEIMNEDSTSA